MNETQEKQQLRWGQGTREAAMDARERLIISAQNCYAQKGIKQTTIAHIAADAQITRRTVYRHFSSHEEILLAVFERVVDIFWQDLQQNLTLQGDFGDCLVEALIYSINYAKTTGRHGYMFANEGQAITNDLYIRHKRFIDASEKGLNTVYQKKLSQGLADEGLNLQMLAEWFNRLILSFLSTPSQLYQTDEDLRQLFRLMLAPVVTINPQMTNDA